jgi:hypothetical protein
MGMENETRDFLVLIANSIALVLIWMILNVLFGIYLEWGFFTGKPGWKNILYYVFSIASLIFLVRRLIKKWS